VYHFPLLASPSKAILDHLANLAVWIHNINHKQHPCGKNMYINWLQLRKSKIHFPSPAAAFQW
jgi:hypothetical protein